MRTLIILFFWALCSIQLQATNISFSPNRNIVICGATTVYFVYNKEIIPDLIYWDFGDGGVSTLVNPEHFYSKPGTYDVKLVIVKNNVRDSLVKKGMITIKPNPTADFAKKITTENPKHSIEFQFTSLSAHCAQRFAKVQWLIANDTLLGDTVNYTFKRDGEYTISLTVENNEGCRAEKVSQISVNNSSSDFPTGISEATLNHVELYPNPANEACYLKLPSTNYQVSVFNILGETQQVRMNNIGGNMLILDVSSLSSGMYFIQVANGNQTTTKSLVVKH